MNIKVYVGIANCCKTSISIFIQFFEQMVMRHLLCERHHAMLKKALRK